MSISTKLQSVFASSTTAVKRTFYEKESSSQKKHGLTVDTVSLSSQVVAMDVTRDSGSTTVAAVAESVSVEKTTVLYDGYDISGFDLENITPDDLDFLSNILYNSGVISKTEWFTLGSIAFYHATANGHVVNHNDSPFSLVNDLHSLASGNYEVMSFSTWGGEHIDYASSGIADNLLLRLLALPIEKVDAEYKSANLSIEA